MKTKNKNKAELKPEPWHEVQKKLIKELQIEAINKDIKLNSAIESSDMTGQTWRNYRSLKRPMKLSNMVALADIVGLDLVVFIDTKPIKENEQAQ